MRRAPAPAKLNLALVVGSLREDGKHEVATVLQRIDLGDRVAISPAPTLAVDGFGEDTIVRSALERLAGAAGIEPHWRATITKRTPVAAGLGGGSSDAATALRLANESLERPLPAEELRALAASIGSDVPFFLVDGPQLARGDGSELTPLDLPQDYWVVLLLPNGATKESTAAVYRAFAERNGSAGSGERFAALEAALAAVRRPRDLAALPYERSRVVALRGRAARARRIPGGRDGSGAGRLRPLPSPSRRRGGTASDRRTRPHLAHRSGVVRVRPARYRLHMSQLPTIEHRQGRFAPVLRQRRSHLVLWIIVIEGLLVILDVIPWWSVLVAAAVALVAYVAFGRDHGNPAVREVAWIAAVSQLVVVLVPVLAVVLTALAVVALVIVAVGALVLLLLDRR